MAIDKVTRRATLVALAAPALLGNDAGAQDSNRSDGPQAMPSRISIFDYLDADTIRGIQSRSLKVDVTAALQEAVDHAFGVGAVIWFPAGSYRITRTIVLDAARHGFSAGLQGENGNSTRIYFESTDPDMFYIGPGVNYFTVKDLEFLDTRKRKACGFHFRDDVTDRSFPSWKHLFSGVRIVDFREGARFDGGDTPPDDRHESEVMFFHSKFRNCANSLVYNNIQAVNHQLIGTDFENDHKDDAVQKWPMIKLERGTFINHVGGSVVGYGPYVTYSFPKDGRFFQNTSQFRSLGIRMEARGNGPFIYHHPTSDIVRSNVLRVVVEGMSVINYGASGQPVLAQFGGRTFAVFKECNANRVMTVDAVVTANLVSNSEFGSIYLDRCKALDYQRVANLAAYGSGPAPEQSTVTIPAEISHATESAPFTRPNDGFPELLRSSQTVYSGGWQVSQPKTLTFSASTTGGIFNAANMSAGLRIRIPKFARPYRFRVLRGRPGAASTLTLFVVNGSRRIAVASIELATGQAGHFSADFRSGNEALPLYRDDSQWDGRMLVTGEGSNPEQTMLMIDYM